MTTKTTTIKKELIGIESIEKALVGLFDKHRLVFWYDEKNELANEFESLKLKNFPEDSLPS